MMHRNYLSRKNVVRSAKACLHGEAANGSEEEDNHIITFKRMSPR